MTDYQNFLDQNLLTHQSLIDKINKLEQQANESIIKLETMRALYISLTNLYHIHDILWNKETKHHDTWKECTATTCQSVKESLADLELAWK